MRTWSHTLSVFAWHILLWLFPCHRQTFSAGNITVLQEGANGGHCCLEVLGALNTSVKDVDILLSILIKLLLHLLTPSSLCPNGVYDIWNIKWHVFRLSFVDAYANHLLVTSFILLNLSSNLCLLECSLDCQSIQHMAFHYGLLKIFFSCSSVKSCCISRNHFLIVELNHKYVGIIKYNCPCGPGNS